MKIDGFCRVEVYNSITGELQETRESHNLVFDINRMRLFFPSLNSASQPIGRNMMLWQNMMLYLSEYTGPITQGSYGSIGPYVRSSSITATATSVDSNTLLYTFPTQIFSGQSIARTLSCVGVCDSSGSYDNYTALLISPTINHNSETTIYLHYRIQVTLQPTDTMFGNEVLTREPSTINGVYSYVYRGTGSPEDNTAPMTVAKPGYRKYYYISPLCRKYYESNTTQYPYPDISYVPWLFKTTDDDSYWAKKGSITIPNTGGRAWCGPYGGMYEMRNSGLGAGCMESPHASRVFAHKSSVSSCIFYDSSEADVPESEGTLVLDVASTDREYPYVYRIKYETDGDVGSAEYSLQEWIMPNYNYFRYPSGFFSYHYYYSYMDYQAPFNSGNTYIKGLYVSHNRKWRVYRLASTSFEAGTSTSESEYIRKYMFVGYENLERHFSNVAYIMMAYCIDNDGIFYHARYETSTQWASGEYYYVGDKVQRGYYVWTCTTNHTASGSNYPGYSGAPWTSSRAGTVVYYYDFGTDEASPTLHTLVDLVDVLPSAGISLISGMCIDEDMKWLWIGTNVGFVKCDLAVSGGPTYEFYDYNTPDFGVYMTAYTDATLLQPQEGHNGKFRADRGKLTWVAWNGTLWHWTGDRDARKYAPPYAINNLFIDYNIHYSVDDEGIIPIMCNDNYIRVVRIGNASTGLVLTYTATQLVASPYSIGMGGGFLWWCNSGDYTDGSDGEGIKGRLNLTTLVNTIQKISYKIQEYITSQGNYVTFGNCKNNTSANRSLIDGVMTMCLTTGNAIVIAVDTGPIFWGWDESLSGGGGWVMGDDTPKITHASTGYLPHGESLAFVDGGIGSSFRDGDYYSFGINPTGIYVDNLQTVTVYLTMYGWHANVVTRTITVPVGSTYTIPEASYPYFINLAAWYRDPHLRAKFLDLSGEPLGTPVAGTPASALQVQFNYTGTVVFYAGHEGEEVEIRYVWLSLDID